MRMPDLRSALFALLPKLNVLLILSAAALVVMLVMTLSRPYELDFAGSRAIDVQESTAPFGGFGDDRFVLDEQLFSRKMLFGDAVRKKQEAPRKEFTLLGISMGRKLLAMLRDTRENKDYYCGIGDSIGDYVVMDIQKDKVVLQSPEGLLEITR